MLDLPTLDAISTMPADDLPALLLQVLTLQSAIVARLVAANGQPVPVPDDLLDCAAAAALITRSPSWMRKHGRNLPGFRQPTGRGGRVGWQRRPLLAWRDGS
jgi:hypothetical protein